MPIPRSERYVYPEGTFTVKLVSTNEETRKTFDKPGEYEPCNEFWFRFDPKQAKADDIPEEYQLLKLTTGMRYGNARATLTKLLNVLHGGPVPPAVLDSAELSDWVGAVIKVTIVHEEGEEGTRWKVANLKSLKPVTVEPLDGAHSAEYDPFVDE